MIHVINPNMAKSTSYLFSIDRLIINVKVSTNNYIIVGRCLLQKFQQKNSCFMMVQAPLLIFPNRNYKDKDMRRLSIYLYSLIYSIVNVSYDFNLEFSYVSYQR